MKLKSVVYWEDGRGNKHDISTISDEYLMNIIAWLQRRKRDLTDAAKEHESELDFGHEHFGMIQVLIEEAERRARDGISIERCDGSESRFH